MSVIEVQAQNNQSPRNITGKVVNSSGDPLEGVTVLEKGTNNGTTTSIDGSFTIQVRNANPVIEFSYVGYRSLEQTPGNNSNLSVTLESLSSNLDDVVVVGYGKQRKGEITGAVASVKEGDFIKGFARDAGQLIQGKVAGLAVVTASGDPNATTQISLRGNSTILSSTQPLVLIDGIPGALNTVAPEDIESIDVLKDGSAAAIYGTRGTNGVVLITTRKKGNRPSSVAYDAFVSVQTIARKMDFLNADDYRRLIADGFFVETPSQKYDYGTSTDWLETITRTPVSHTHNLTFQGGNGQTNYIASLNLRSWQGLFKKSDNTQMTGRVDVNHSMFDGKLNINLNVIGRNRKFFSAPNYAYIYRQAIIRNPTDSIYNYLGRWKEDPNAYNYDNPLRPIEEVTGETGVSEMRYNGSITFSPIRDLNMKLLMSSVKVSSLSGYAESFDHRASEVNNRTGYASRNTSLFKDDLLEFTTDYSKSFSEHRFTLLGGYSYQDVSNEGFGAENSNFPSELYTYNRLQSGDALLQQNGPMGMSSYKSNHKLIGFFGRLNYSFNEKYLLMASLRYEGSSKFGANYKWGTFPAISAGWRISRENFMQSVTFINDLKLRAGFGVTGTVPSDPYMSLISLNYNSASRFLYNGRWIQPIEPVRNPNPDLRWEKKEEYNFGLDFAMFNSRLNGSLDIYQRNTLDMLYNFPVPVPPNLFGSTTANAGQMKNQGIEVLLNYDFIRQQDLYFGANLTFSSNKNTLISISNDIYQTTNDFFFAGHTGEPIQITTHQVKVGEPIGNFFGYKSIDIDEQGKWIIEGVDGKPKPLADGSPDDRQVLGNGIPRYTAGLNLSFRLKAFDLAVNMRGAFDYQILNFQRLYYENPTIKQYNMLRTTFDPVYGKTMLTNPLAYVSHYIEDGDHWKIDNVTLGYNIPVSGSKIFKNARVYASALNLAVITGYKGIDPEVTRLGLDPGSDSRDKYPTTRTFTFGVNLIF